MYQQQQLHQQQQQMLVPSSVKHFRPQEVLNQLPIEQQTLESTIVPHRPGKLNYRHRQQQSESIKSRVQEEVVPKPSTHVGPKVATPKKNGWVEPVIIMMDIDHHDNHLGEASKSESFANMPEEDRQQIVSPREPFPIQQDVGPDNSLYQGEMEPEVNIEDIDQHQAPSFPTPLPFVVSDGIKL